MKRSTDVLSQEKRKRKGLDLTRKIGFICEMLTTDIECFRVSPLCFSYLLIALTEAEF